MTKIGGYLSNCSAEVEVNTGNETLYMTMSKLNAVKKYLLLIIFHP